MLITRSSTIHVLHALLFFVRGFFDLRFFDLVIVIGVGVVIVIVEDVDAVGLGVEPRRRLSGLGRLALVVDGGANWHAEHEVLARAAVLAGPGPRPTALGVVVLPVLEIDQRRERVGRDDPDVAAVASIAARGAALGDVGFTAPRDGAVATVAGVNLNPNAVDEAHARLHMRTALATEVARAGNPAP